MNIVYTIHRVLGMELLPLLTLLSAIWLTVRWRPSAPDPVGRYFPLLINLQILLGLVYFIYRIAIGSAANLLTFPFILHPILGLVAGYIANRSLRPGSFTSGLGRWQPLASLGILLVLVVANVVIARMF